MKTRAQKIRLGIFLIVSLALLIAMIGLFTVQRFFQEQDTYYVAYEGISVSGLEVGSPVKYLGIKVGVIRDISIDPEDVSRVIVKLSLNPGTPVKADATAAITTVGITGLKTIEISGGSNQADFLPQNGYLKAGSSITEEITGKAEVIAEKVELVLNNLQRFTKPENLDKVTVMIETVTRLATQANATISTIDTVLSENREDVRATLTAAKVISDRIDSSTVDLQRMIYRINTLVESDTIGEILAGARDVAIKLREANITKLIEEMGQVAQQTNQLLLQLDQDLDQGSQEFVESLMLLRSTLENLNEASQMINNDPSILLRGTKVKDEPDKHLTND